MSISKEQVNHVAHLAKLELSEEEIGVFTSQLSDILTMVEHLDEVDTTGVKPTTNVIFDENLWSEDVAQKPMDRDELMKNVPVHENGYIKVPAMLNQGEEE